MKTKRRPVPDMEFHKVRELANRIDFASNGGNAFEYNGTFPCESASDLPEIAHNALRLGGMGGRDIALLRYYVAQVECEDGACTSVDHAAARALLHWHETGEIDAARRVFEDALAAWVAAGGENGGAT